MRGPLSSGLSISQECLTPGQETRLFEDRKQAIMGSEYALGPHCGRGIHADASAGPQDPGLGVRTPGSPSELQGAEASWPQELEAQNTCAHWVVQTLTHGCTETPVCKDVISTQCCGDCRSGALSRTICASGCVVKARSVLLTLCSGL